MERSKPSTEWNKKERLEVIATISMELIEVSRRGRAVPADAVFDRAQRIQLVQHSPHSSSNTTGNRSSTDFRPLPPYKTEKQRRDSFIAVFIL